MFIVCGSATSWLHDKILKNKGGLFNRHSALINLKPFTLKETKQYLLSNNVNWSLEDIIKIYMILGGIPYYLNYLDGNYTLSENVDKLFFEKNSPLRNEFDLLYSTLFENQENIIKIIEALNSKRYGMTRKEISQVTKLQYNGILSEALKSLIVSGFVESFVRYGDKKDTCYKLVDYFSIFYLKFIKNNKKNIDQKFWSNSYSSQSRVNFEAYAFELLCLNQIDKIKDALSIGGVVSENYPWYKKADGIEDGAQIDLVIDRKDHVITICEIKFYQDAFEIDKEYAFKLKRKIEVFTKTTGCKKTIQLAFISLYGVKKNMYSNIVNKNIIIDDLF